jgi:hypothetical protein
MTKLGGQTEACPVHSVPAEFSLGCLDSVPRPDAPEGWCDAAILTIPVKGSPYFILVAAPALESPKSWESGCG